MYFYELNNPETSHQRRAEIGDELAADGDPREGVGLRDDGMPDIEWCFVEGGTLELKGDSFEVADFYIAKYPVTYVQYQTFVDAPDGYTRDVWWHEMPLEFHQQELADQNQAGDNQPRDSLSWYQAVAFSRWLNAMTKPSTTLLGWSVRLPLEWEWRWAAQGGACQREFPFGDWNPAYTNTTEAGLNRTVAVGMYPDGMALCEAHDMAGNVWEWCLNDFNEVRRVDYNNGAMKVRRGGSFNFTKTFARTGYRDIVKPYTHSSFNGMRLVLAPPISS